MSSLSPKLLAALREDLGKPPFEAYASELGVVYEDPQAPHTWKAG